MSATADRSASGPAPGGAVLRALTKLGAGVAIGIALQTVYTAYFGMFEPSLHRGAIIGAAAATLLLLKPAGAGRRGAAAALWWGVDLAMLMLLAAALWRFFAAADNLENALIDYERWEQWLGLGGVLVVLELTRRQFGWPLFAVCLLALLYCLFGQYLPTFLRHTGFPLDQTMQTLWFGLQGVFGLPTSVVLQLVLIFIVFGVVLEGTGAGAALIRIAFSLTGGSRGGPAHAAVMASAIFGTMSGSVAANVVGTGTITMPLIKQRGFSPAFAGAVEAAASTGGQIMPPVMGAAAFYMAQLTGHSYLAICAAALLPSLLYYLGLGAAVSLEARRLGIAKVPRAQRARLTRRDLIDSLMFVIPVVVIVLVMVSGRSPAMAGFWAVVSALALGFALNPDLRANPQRLWRTLSDAGAAGATIVIAVGAIGVIIGINNLTGIGLKFAFLVETLSDGSLIAGLLVMAGACLVLGMGMPTLPAYIIVVLVMGPAIRKLGVPDLAIHMFVFYFGVLSAITPPVALGAFAAAPIAGANPLTIGFVACRIAFAGFLIPFAFINTPGLLLVIGIEPARFGFALVELVLAIWLLTAALVGHEKRALAAWERLLRAALAATLLSGIWPVEIAALIAGGLLCLHHWGLEGRTARQAVP